MLSGALKSRPRVFHSAVRHKPASFPSNCAAAAQRWCFYTQVAYSNQKLTLSQANPAKQPRCEIPPALVQPAPEPHDQELLGSARTEVIPTAKRPHAAQPTNRALRVGFTHACPSPALRPSSPSPQLPAAGCRGIPRSPPGPHREAPLRLRSGRDERAAPEVTGAAEGVQRLRTHCPRNPNRQLMGLGEGRGSSLVRAASARYDWLRAHWRKIRLAAARGAWRCDDLRGERDVKGGR